ncbi:UGT-54 protein [Aphelenchoides avenae]|nr:UGT-54 protein [Aphelenchus avenae]
MPSSMKRSFLAAFARFAQYQFIWKSRTNANDTQMLPRNVHVFEWIDQVSVLAHSKTLAFITHCGLNSINEAATHGVPMVAIPLVSDGFYNAATAVKQRTAVYVDVDRITTEIVVDALEKVLGDPRLRGGILVTF